MGPCCMVGISTNENPPDPPARPIPGLDPPRRRDDPLPLPYPGLPCLETRLCGLSFLTRDVARESRIDHDLRLVVKHVTAEMEQEADRPEDAPVRMALIGFFSLFEMLRRGWSVPRNGPASHFRSFVEEMGWPELTIIYKDNIEKLLAAIVRLMESMGVPLTEVQQQRLSDQVRRIHYLKYLEEGEERIIRSRVDRLIQRVPGLLFALSLVLGIAAVAAGFHAAGFVLLVVASGALKLWSALRRSFDMELRLLSQRILGSLSLDERDRACLVQRLTALYQKAEIEGGGTGPMTWLAGTMRPGLHRFSLVSRPGWLTEVVRGHLTTAATLAKSYEELQRLFHVVEPRLEDLLSRPLEERLLLLGILTSLAGRIRELRGEPEFRAGYYGVLRVCFRQAGTDALGHPLGGEFVDSVTLFGGYREFMTERFGTALHHGRLGLWSEFDAYLRHAGRHACWEVLEELMRVAETVQPCREGCCYTDGLSHERVILYDARRRALYQALWIVYLNLKEREKVLLADRMRRFLDRAVFDENARIACDILQKMAHQEYHSSPAVVELLSLPYGRCHPEVRRRARALRENYDQEVHRLD